MKHQNKDTQVMPPWHSWQHVSLCHPLPTLVGDGPELLLGVSSFSLPWQFVRSCHVVWHILDPVMGWVVTACHQIWAITKSAFLALSEEEWGGLLDDFLIVKDTNVLPECLPQSVTILSASWLMLLISTLQTSCGSCLRVRTHSCYRHRWRWCNCCDG